MDKTAWFEEHSGHFATNGYSFPPWAIYEQFLAVVDGPGPILELGCGNGLLLRFLHDLSGHRLEPFGADINADAIREAKAVIFPERADCFVHADLREGIPHPGPFRTVIANPLHADRGYAEQVDGKIPKLHLDGSLQAYIAACWRVVAPGGRLALWCYDGHIAEIAPQHAELNAAIAGTGVRVREFASGPVNFWLSEPKPGV